MAKQNIPKQTPKTNPIPKTNPTPKTNPERGLQEQKGIGRPPVTKK